MMDDPLSGFPVEKEESHASKLFRAVGILIMVVAIATCLVALTATSGCTTAAKNIIMPTPEPTPIPTTTPTEIPTPTPAPTPVPTPDFSNCNAAEHCFKLREWHHMYKPGVQGDGIDLVLHATVYDWMIVDGPYHYHSVSQGTYAFEDHRPYPGFKYLFVMVNVMSDTNANPYGFPRRDWVVQVRDRVYFYDWDYDPTKWIWELQDHFAFNREGMVQPYGYRIVQERVTGIITAEELGQIYKGGSNSWDGYIIFEVPLEATPDEIKVGGNFANIGGYAWWTLL